MTRFIDVVFLDLKANGVSRTGYLGLLQGLAICPGFAVCFWYRLSKKFYRMRFLKVLSKLLWLHNVRSYGCYLSPLSDIGVSFCLPHPIGVVIGEHVSIGDDCRIYQNVTLGVRSTKNRRVPIIEDRVTVYAGAVIVGCVSIESDSAVPANALIVGRKE